MAHRPALFLSLIETGNSETDHLTNRLKSLANVTETVGGIVALINALRRASHDPDIIFIELDGEPRDIFKALNMLKEHVPNTCTVYGFGKINDVGFLRSLLAVGFADYFVSPFQDALLDEISHIIGKRDNTPHAPVIGFISLAGGVGTSLVALNFAQFLAERSASDVILYHPQPVPYNTQFERYDFDPSDDGQTPYPALIKQDPTLRDDDERETEIQKDMIDTHRARGSIIVVDIGTHLAQKDILSRCDHMIVIGEPDYRSLLNAKPLNEFLVSHYPFSERHFALTKIGLGGRIEFSQNEVQSLFDEYPVQLYKYDLEAIASALTKPVPLLPVTLLKDQHAFEILSKRCKIALKQVTDETHKRSRFFTNLFTFLKKWNLSNG